MADGALGSRGAALLEPYSDEPSTTGLLVTPPDEVYAQTIAAARAGFQPAVHAIGDRANRFVLDVFERVQRESLGVVASMQPTHATSDMPWAPSRVGEARINEGAYAWRKLLDSGAVIASGSDFPVEEANPMLGLYAAVTRQDPAGNPPGGWTAGERMTRAEAIASFTRHAAWAAHAETQTGSIEAGKLADLVVLSKDVMQIPAQEILTTTVRMTIIGGEIVYERPSP
jgi:predicted amidohydrolase YtcJ